MGFHPLNALSLHLKIDAQHTFITERVRLDDIHTVSVKLVKYVPQLAVNERTVVGSAFPFAFLLLLVLLDFEVCEFIFRVLIVGEPSSERCCNCRNNTPDCYDDVRYVFHKAI